MSRQIQIRRGTAAAHSTFTGAPGELTFDTDTKTLRVHDGTTPGGITLAKENETPDLTSLISAAFPDYANAITITAPLSANPYQVSDNCLLYIEVRGNYFKQINCVINGNTFVVGRGNNQGIYQSNNLTLPLKRGDTFYMSPTGGGPYDYNIYIIPLMGV